MRISGGERGRYWLSIAVAVGALMLPTAALAGSWDIGDGLSASWKVSLNYALMWRAKNPDNALINGPIDPLQPDVMPQNGTSQQLIGFSHSGLSTTINTDDGNRNFRKFDLIHNRASAFGEMDLTWKNFGAVFSGSAFYDDVYMGHNSNDSLPYPEMGSTVNKPGDPRRFNKGARYYDGKRGRLLEAYAYGDFNFGDMYLDVRVGQQLVAWGQSLFLSGISSAQGPADATKAFIPGAEVKDILLPVNQVGLRLSVNLDLTLMAYYKLDYRHTEVFPQGDYFSPSEAVGPGAGLVYGSINPAALEGCPGLLGPLSQLCNLGGIGRPLLNAPNYIMVYRTDDDIPSKKNQWGVGATYQLFPTFMVGVYRQHYNDTNPTVMLETGFALIGSVAGVPITTGLINQTVPVSYHIKYWGGIDMTSLTYSTLIGPVQVGGEFNYRQGVPTAVQAMISGVDTPIYTRSDISQALVSGLYTFNPGMIVDTLTFVGEAGYVYVNDVDPISASPGITPLGNGDKLYFDKESYGFQSRIQTQNRNIISGWDLNGLLTYGQIIKGNPSLAGAFGALFGEGSRNLTVGASMQYLQNLEVGVGYTFFFGNPHKIITGTKNGPVHQNPYADRDYFTLNVKYNL